MNKKDILYKMKRAYRLGQEHALDAAIFGVPLKVDSTIDEFMESIFNEGISKRATKGANGTCP